MGAEFSHLNIANVREVIACDLRDVMSLYHELMDQKAEFKGVNLELEEDRRKEKVPNHVQEDNNGEQGKEKNQQRASAERKDIPTRDSHGHDTHTIEEGNENEGKGTVDEMSIGTNQSSDDKHSLQSQLSKGSEIDLDIPFQAPQFYVARADFSVAMDELPVIFKGYRKEDISLFTDIYMRMDDLGTDDLSFKDLVICIVLLLSPDITSCFLNAFKVYDYEKKDLLERKEFVKIFNTIN